MVAVVAVVVVVMIDRGDCDETMMMGRERGKGRSRSNSSTKDTARLKYTTVVGWLLRDVRSETSSKRGMCEERPAFRGGHTCTKREGPIRGESLKWFTTARD